MRFGVLTFVSGMSFQAALIGLPLSAVLSLGDPLEWQIELGPIGLVGSLASLVLFVVYILSRAVLWRCLRVRLIDRQSMTRMEEILHAPRDAVIIAIPIAVVLVWLGS